MNVTKNVKIVVERVESIVGKGENAGVPAFSPLPAMSFTSGL